MALRQREEGRKGELMDEAGAVLRGSEEIDRVAVGFGECDRRGCGIFGWLSRGRVV